jgi:hypothetical protein
MTRRHSTEEEYCFSLIKILQTSFWWDEELRLSRVELPQFSHREKEDLLFPTTVDYWYDTQNNNSTTTFSVVTSIYEMRFWGRHARPRRGYATAIQRNR